MGKKIEYVPEKYFLSLNILYITNPENVFPEKSYNGGTIKIFRIPSYINI